VRGPARVLAARWGDGHLALVTPRGAAHVLTRPSPHCGAVFWKARSVHQRCFCCAARTSQRDIMTL